MARFRIFYFRDSVLDRAEEVEARDILEIIKTATGKSPELRAEIWSENGKVGIVGESLTVAHRIMPGGGGRRER